MSLSKLRIGFGTDIHRFAKGRKLILGGVTLPHSRGLAGHSDADALAHAVIDAMLGAMGASDIGELFPDTSAAYKGADSMVLLGRIVALAKRSRYRLVNLDAVISAEEPRFSPYKEKIRVSLARALGVETGRVNVKAKTREGLDSVGAKKALAVECVVLMEKF